MCWVNAGKSLLWKEEALCLQWKWEQSWWGTGVWLLLRKDGEEGERGEGSTVDVMPRGGEQGGREGEEVASVSSGCTHPPGEAWWGLWVMWVFWGCGTEWHHWHKAENKRCRGVWQLQLIISNSVSSNSGNKVWIMLKMLSIIQTHSTVCFFLLQSQRMHGHFSYPA